MSSTMAATAVEESGSDSRSVTQTKTPRSPDPGVNWNDFETWTWKQCKKDLVGTVSPWPFFARFYKEKGFDVNLAEAHRLYVLKLQARLTEHIGHWFQDNDLSFQHCTSGAVGLWVDDMHRYNIDDPTLPHRFTVNWNQEPGRIIPRKLDKFYFLIQHSTLNRLIVTVTGASFLIEPMWLMVVRPEVFLGVGSTSVFVLAFSLMMSYVLDKYIDILSSSAAYAAVLVVFVGLIIEGQTESLS
ncbi:hypothetical protein QBC38DRAFT_527177 [Podospora fimiseda]|uniref:DUF6594 domain-containing protein n=1 Tax=Podospora fimiseda TaxID=252190 RepID=A0AAN7H474_9PEZI|nr:hypothetical protein QBC38DRAFT_527177 [Podospora fimiseda]